MQATGQKLADTLKNGESVVVELDFKESMAHPDDRYSMRHCPQDWLIIIGGNSFVTLRSWLDMVRQHSCKSASTEFLLVLRVEWEFWTSSNDACGSSCDRQSRFKLDFAETAINLEKVGLFKSPAQLSVTIFAQII